MFLKNKFIFTFIVVLCFQQLLFSQEVITHVVLKGETKYSLAKQYGVSIAELEQQNPHTIPVLLEGQKLVIDKNATASTTTNTSSTVSIQQNVIKNTVSEYKIESGDTKFKIATKFKISIAQLDAANPGLGEVIYADQIINIPSKIGTNVVTVTTNVENNTAYVPDNSLLSNLEAKTIALKFLVAKDSNVEDVEAYKNGAQIALDSLSKLGVKTNAEFITVDSTFSKNVSADAFISFATNTAIETFANEIDKPVFFGDIVNTTRTVNSGYFARGSQQARQKIILDYLVTQKNTKPVFVYDNENKADNNAIAMFYPNIEFFAFKSIDDYDAKALKNTLSKSKNNILLFNLKNLKAVISFTNSLLPLLKEYNIQIATYKDLDLLTKDEISSNRYAVLKLIYPQYNNFTYTINNSTSFYTSYVNKNKKEPNQASVIGFDVTFDAVLRLCQTEKLSKAMDIESKQISLPFKYETVRSNYVNNDIGVYLYESDSVKKKLSK